jgi:hypothetical protein
MLQDLWEFEVHARPMRADAMSILGFAERLLDDTALRQ